MSNHDKEMKWRNEGMAYAYQFVKTNGLEALEEEIKFRNTTHIPLSVSEKAYKESIERMKNNTLDTILIMAAYVLYQKNGFCHLQIAQFIENMEEESGNLTCMDDWNKYIEFVAENTDIHLSIRKNGW